LRLAVRPSISLAHIVGVPSPTIASYSIDFPIWAQRHSKLISLLNHFRVLCPLPFLEVKAVKLSEDGAAVPSTEEDLTLILLDTGGKARSRFRHLERQQLELIGLQIVFFYLACPLSISLLPSKQEDP